MALWEECRDWLVRIGALSSSRAVVHPDDTLFDFAMALRDGAVLCSAANIILPPEDQIHFFSPATMTVMKKHNAEQFLAAAEACGVDPAALFKPRDLFEANNFLQIVTCVSKFSFTKAAASACVLPFPKRSPRVLRKSGAAPSQPRHIYQNLDSDAAGAATTIAGGEAAAAVPTDDIYDMLKKDVARVNSDTIDGYDDTEGDDDMDAHMYEYEEMGDVYDVCMNDVAFAPVTIGGQDIYAGSGDKGRDHALQELLYTEGTYIGVLDCIIDDFKIPLAKHLPNEDICVIFSHIDELRGLHADFLVALQKQMESETGRNVSIPFMDFAKPMQVYGNYGCSAPLAVNKLKSLGKVKASRQVLEAVTSNSRQKFQLKDLLCVPMQRIVKYPLLLKELIKRTPKDHPDAAGLLAAERQSIEQATYVNACMAQDESLREVKNVLRKYDGPPLQSFGALLCKSHLSVVKNPSGGHSPKRERAYVILFERAIMITKQKSAQSSLFRSLRQKKSNTLEFQELIELSLHMDTEDRSGDKWKLTGGVTEVVFEAASAPEKKEWVTAIDNALHAIHNKVKRLAPTLPAAEPIDSYNTWYHPSVKGKGEAAILLHGHPDGTFLVRPSKTSVDGEYRMNLMYRGDVKNFIIFTHNCLGFGLDQIEATSHAFPSVPELIHFYRANSIQTKFPGITCKLGGPARGGVVFDGGRAAAGGPAAGRSNVSSGHKSSKQSTPQKRDSLPIPMLPDRRLKRPSSLGRASVKHPYQAKLSDELTIKRGQTIEILRKDGSDEGWWEGRLENGTRGYFPANYVVIGD
mmetsp:Transcript_15068/g.38720  ORF Transcript_15068/g.38720 Transcript_15068/m.38720 type:complete len:803 (+) Transcript_15068:197-2605(+)